MPTYIQGDFGFPINFVIYNPDGTVLNLTGATITFQMRGITATTLKINSACTIVDAINGKCKYTVLTTDFNTAGQYFARLVVTFTSPSSQQTSILEEFSIIPSLP